MTNTTGMPENGPCDHTCYCGTADHVPHRIGENGCVRFITEAPILTREGFWKVDGEIITDFTLRQQRGYYQHSCGCWSRWPGSINSIEG